MAGREMTRQSSFEKMMNLVTADSCHQIGASDTDKNKAAYELQLWWAKERKIIQTKKDILNTANHVTVILESIESVRNNLGNFRAVQKILSASPFISSLNIFLSALPLDPSLKAKNSTARSSHTIGSAFFIHYFRGEVLLDDDARDLSREADECAIAAEMVIRALNSFIVKCSKLTPTTATVTNTQFKKSLLSYRFSVRYFIEKLEQWKGLDASRLLQSLEAPYTESYVIFLTLSKVLKNSGAENNSELNAEGGDSRGLTDNENETTDQNTMMLRTAEQQCLKIKQAMVKLLGPRAQTRIEELNAQIEAAMINSVGGDEWPEAVLLTAASRVLTAVDGTNIQHIESVASLPPSPLPNSPRQGDDSAAELPKEFSHIGMILKRIAATGGISSPSAGFEPDASQEFQVGDDRHQLIHELCLNPLYKLADTPDPAGIDLNFYSRYFLPTPPSMNIQTGGWPHMIQSPLYPRSPLVLSPSVPQGEGFEGAMDQVQISMKQIEAKIKASMLFMMDDNIVCSLARSPFNEQNLNEIDVGTIIPLRYSNGQTDHMVLSARVIAVHHGSPTTADPKVLGRESIHSIDVEYLSDCTIEKNVPLKRVKFSTDPPAPTPFLMALQDTLNRVAGLTPHRADLHSELSAAVDFPMWMQMIVHSAMTVTDVSRIFSHIFACISKLQAPIRSESFNRWTNEYLRLISASSLFESSIPLLPLLFEFTSSCIDEIKRDMANFHVATLSRLVQGPLGVQFLSHYILKDTMATDGKGRTCLDSTVSLLVYLLSATGKRAEVVAELLEATGQEIDMDTLYMDERTFQAQHSVASTATTTTGSSSGSGGSTQPHRVSARTSVVAVTMLRLLQFPYRLGGPLVNARMLPETFLFDGQRLSHLRDLVDVISVQCTVMITIRQALQKIGLLSSEAEETVLFARFNVLLRDQTVGMKSIVTEAVRFVRTSIENAKGDISSPNSPRAPLALASADSPGSVAAVHGAAIVGAPHSPRPSATSCPDWEEVLEKSLRNVLAEGNPVLALFTKRVYKVLLRAILNQPYAAKLPSFSLHAKGIQKNLGELITRAVKLFDIHIAEYGEVYATIFYHPTVQNYLFPIDVEVD